LLAAACGDTIRPGFPDTQWAVLANGRHFPFYEEPAHNSQTLAASHAEVDEDGQRAAHRAVLLHSPAALVRPRREVWPWCSRWVLLIE
jgi:hypothetical protein